MAGGGKGDGGESGAVHRQLQATGQIHSPAHVRFIFGSSASLLEAEVLGEGTRMW